MVDGEDSGRPVPQEVTAETEIVAVGGRPTADTIVAAYRRGVFPMSVLAEVADGATAEVMAWFAPDPRAVLEYPGMHVSRSLRRSLRRFRTSVDEDFLGVLEGCADPSREHGWITDDFRRAYLDLHLRGMAHSVEVWQAGELVGGLIGVEVGGLFCADSKFRRVTDASKVAVARLSAEVFSAPDGRERLIDAQWPTEHLRSLGFVGLARPDYEVRLPMLTAMRAVFGH